MSRAVTYYTKLVNWLYSSNSSNVFITRAIYVPTELTHFTLNIWQIRQDLFIKNQNNMRGFTLAVVFYL